MLMAAIQFRHLLEKCRNVEDLKPIIASTIVAGLLNDPLIVNKVLTSGCSGGGLEYIDLLLERVGDPNPGSWNNAIRGCEQSHNPREAIKLYDCMLRSGVSHDKFTFPFVLKACADARALCEGEQVHCRILKSPLNMDLFVHGSLIFMYAKCGKIEAARVSFNETHHKNLISWNTMIDGYVKHGNIGAAVELFESMPDRDLFSWNTMIDGYTKCGQIECARRLFDKMSERDIVSWNIMIDGYAKCGNMKAAKELFGMTPFKDMLTWGIMIDGYTKSNQIEIAHSWFEKVPYRNLVTWNSLINGYAKCGNVVAARKLFDLMPCKNSTSWNIMLDAYARYGDIEFAWHLFDMMPSKDIFSWNIIITGHARLGLIKVARDLFDTMPCRDIVSWNAIITGYKENGQLKEAIELFGNMCMQGENPDYSTLAVVLSAIAELGLLQQGMWVHDYIDRNKFPLNSIIGASLIDMYAKCGYLDMAMKIFDRIPKKSKDHWNAMISGLAGHGHGSHAISLFGDMEQSLVRPDDITFIGILNACSHAGLLREGHYYFELMNIKYGLTPKIQHYGCMVDLLSRAGHLEAAVAMVNNMPMCANDVVWRALLGASRNHGNLEIAEYAARHLIELVPHDSSSYVLLANIYGYKGHKESAGIMWNLMKDRGVLKTPACSSIEVKGVFHEFIVGYTHPKILEIRLLLNSMSKEMMLAGYIPDGKHLLFEIT